MCNYQEAVKCLAEKYIEAEYYAVGKDFTKLDKKKLKKRIIEFVDAEFESTFKRVKEKFKK